MYKRFILPLLEAEKRIKDYRRDEQWHQLRDITLICISAFLLMSVVNIFQPTRSCLTSCGTTVSIPLT